MANSNPHRQPQKQRAFVVLRPLLWWVFLVLVLFAIKTHERLSARTTVLFDLFLDGKPNDEITVRRDGNLYTGGLPVSLGNHEFTFTHRNGVPFKTNLFVFYGEHSLGKVNLQRAKGMISLTVVPPARRLWIKGREFETNLMGASSFSASLPTGDYLVEAQFRHSTEKRRLDLLEMGGSLHIDPKIGALQIAANQENATFTVFDSKGTEIEHGSAPFLIEELPAGKYQVALFHHDHRSEVIGEVETGKTNSVLGHFRYGALSLKSTPPGATVRDAGGKILGKTPLSVSDLDPGTLRFFLQLDSFEPGELEVTVKEGETNIANLKLVRTAFLEAMRQGRASLSNLDFGNAAAAFKEALGLEEANQDARVLFQQCEREIAFSRARRFAEASRFKDAINEVKSFLAQFPDDTAAERLVAEYNSRDAALSRAREEARLSRAKTLMNEAVSRNADAALFETHRLVSKKRLHEVKEEIVKELKQTPEFSVSASEGEGGFSLVGRIEFSTALGTSAGRRECIVTGAQVTNDETEILFKVLEYKVEAVNKLSIGNLIKTPVAVNYIPIRAPLFSSTPPDKFQLRLDEGFKDVEARLKRAVGQ